MKGKIVLENGMEFYGNIIGDYSETTGEIVFNTGMTGYQEIMTDPSYYGQVVVFTYPLIGNYGINLDDSESSSPKVKGIIVREYCDKPNNFRNEMSLKNYLDINKLVGIADVDTRALTKVIREKGCMKGVIVTFDRSSESVMNMINEYDNTFAVKMVSPKEERIFSDGGKKVAVIDYGIKENILKELSKRDCAVKVFPFDSKAEDILKWTPDLVFLSNGPGDPKDLNESVETIKNLIGKVPISGICLGHQLLSLSCGGKTNKMKYGHRGCNHPVKDLKTGKVYITSQNHGYYVSEIPEEFLETHISVNDGTNEGMEHKILPIKSVQFHPEANPGPHDVKFIFDEFLKLIC